MSGNDDDDDDDDDEDDGGGGVFVPAGIPPHLLSHCHDTSLEQIPSLWRLGSHIV